MWITTHKINHISNFIFLKRQCLELEIRDRLKNPPDSYALTPMQAY